MLRTLLIASLGALLLAPAASAQEPAGEALSASRQAAAELGPAIGSAAPAFTLTDSEGQTRTLSTLTGERGVVIYFNRSLDWCPICLRQTLEINEVTDQFDAAGWGVAVLTYDSAETLARISQRRELFGLTLLSDPDSAVIDAFGVRDPIYSDPDHMAYGVPYPIAFAINPAGQIVAKYWHEAGFGQQRGYATRISAEDVLADLN